MKQLAWFFSLLLFACGVNESKIEGIDNSIISDYEVVIAEKFLVDEVDSTVRFLNFYKNFTTALFEGKMEILNQCFHPDYGVKIIENFSGAMPQIISYANSSYFDHDEPVRKAFENLDSLMLIQPVFEELPEIICEDEFYSKLGCFVSEEKNNLDQHPWNVEGKYNDLLSSIKYTVVNTYNITIYCSEIDNKWYVTFIDLRVPCQA